VLTGEFTALGVTRMLEAMRAWPQGAVLSGLVQSEMFGKVVETPQRESTPFYPRSPYGVAKVYGHWITVNYRESLRALRGERHPVQSRVAAPRARVRHAQDHGRRGAHQARAGRRAALGNLDARRDWGFAGDYVDAMWRMLQPDTPDDYVIGTGETWSVRQLCEEAFSYVDLDWQQYVKKDERFKRPAEVDLLVADPSKAKRELGLGADRPVPRPRANDGGRGPQAASPAVAPA
jgi:GDPmannose 4,6-dehydratase